MSELRLAPTLVLPQEATTWVISFLAKRGAGKTYNASVLAEEMLKQHTPIIVIDGMGIWWGLRVSNNGKSSGLPIVVFGGEHADLPLIPEKTKEMAKAIVESNISCVLDLSGFSKYTMRKVLTVFLNELYRLNRAVRHVFIEESDMFAPQRPIGDEANLCLSAVDNFVRRGGNHNLGVTLITQRSAVLNKDILTQSDCLVVLRTLAPQDKKAIQSWVEEQTDEDKSKLKEWYDSLKSLDNGEAWVWHPEKPTIFQKVKFRTRETFHATREFIRSPNATNLPLIDVQEFIEKFKTSFKTKIEPEKPNNNTTQQLENHIENLETELANTKILNEKIRKELADAHQENKTLKTEVANLESARKIRDALLELIPQQHTIENTEHPKATMDLTHQPLQVNIQQVEPETIKLSTTTKEGQMMYCIVNELPNDENGFSNADVIAKALEHGWAINKSTVSVTLSKWASKGTLIKTNKGYRLPKFVKYEVN